MSKRKDPRPLEWHRDGLRNRRDYLAAKELASERLCREIAELRIRIAFTEAQLVEAERLGLDAFDPETPVKALRRQVKR